MTGSPERDMGGPAPLTEEQEDIVALYESWCGRMDFSSFARRLMEKGAWTNGVDCFGFTWDDGGKFVCGSLTGFHPGISESYRVKLSPEETVYALGRGERASLKRAEQRSIPGAREEYGELLRELTRLILKGRA